MGGEEDEQRRERERGERAATIAPPPLKKPNATPVLRVLTRSSPGTTSTRSSRPIEPRTIAFDAWSAASTPTATTTARSTARARRHGAIRQTMMLPTIRRTKIATIGLRSIGPNRSGRRRKIRRYGSETSRRKSSTALKQRL